MGPVFRLLALGCVALVAAAPNGSGRDEPPAVPSDPRQVLCPGYIQCPYPEYPRPTTKRPTPVQSSTPTSSEKPAEKPTEKPIVDYFGSGEPAAAPDAPPVPQSSTMQPPDGSGSRPAVSVTSKPNCPWYIQCPYPEYPRPTTKGTTEANEVSTAATSTKNPEDNPIVEYFGSGSPENAGTSDTKPEKEPEGKPDQAGNVNKPTVSASGSKPAVSATQKPNCPSFIQCPYPEYPRPTTKGTTEANEVSTAASSTKAPEDKPIVEYFGSGSPENVGTSDLKPEKEPENKPEVPAVVNKPTIGDSDNRPAVSATQKPNCPSFIQCPYPEYPQPTTKGTTEVNKVDVTTPNTIPLNPESPSPTPSTQLLVDYIMGQINSSSEESSSNSEEPGKTEAPSNTPSVDKPSVSATQKPPCPSYIQCPYPEYPRPTTKRTIEGYAVTPSPANAPQQLQMESGSPEPALADEKDAVMAETGAREPVSPS